MVAADLALVMEPQMMVVVTTLAGLSRICGRKPGGDGLRLLKGSDHFPHQRNRSGGHLEVMLEIEILQNDNHGKVTLNASVLRSPLCS